MYARDTALIATPLGRVRIEGRHDRIERIRLEPATRDEMTTHGDAVKATAAQLLAWFAGERRTFDLPLAPAAIPRGQALRDGMIDINCGDTVSYGALSRRLSSGARALGQACARNPFPIVVPCHRVLNADGTLGAYSGGDGPAIKHRLLAHEQQVLARSK